MTNQQHAVYGLYLEAEPDHILYGGSWSVVGLALRLHEHQSGICRTTRKMAERTGVDLSRLRMRVLRYWTQGIDACPEGTVVRALQERGQCRWNGPYTFSPEDVSRGGKLCPREVRVRNGSLTGATNLRRGLAQIVGTARGRQHRIRCGQRGAEAVRSLARTPEGHAAFVQSGRVGGYIGMCSRWHTDRAKVNRLCQECAIKSMA